jgi:hypothetical protein
MTGIRDPQWSFQVGWCRCPEPVRSELDQLTKEWLDGCVTNECLAIRLWEFWTRQEFMNSASSGRFAKSHIEVQRALTVLAYAMLAAVEIGVSSSVVREELLNRAAAAPDYPVPQR